MTGIPPTGHQEIEFVQALTGALQKANKNIGRFNQLFGAHLNQTYTGSQQFQQLHALVSTFAQQGKWSETKCKQIKSVAKALLGQSPQPPQQQQVMAATASSSTSSSVSSTARARKTRPRQEETQEGAQEEQVAAGGRTKKSKVESSADAASAPPSQVLPPQVANASSLFSRASTTTLRAGRHVWRQKFSILGRTTKALGLFTTAMAVFATPAPKAAASLAATSLLLLKASHWISQISPPPPPALSDLSANERKERIKSLEAALHARVKGQEYAKQEVISSLRMNLLGRGRPEHCLGCYFFAGSTGIGKTKMASTISEVLFGKENKDAILSIDGGLYQREGDEKALTGAAPSYVGHKPEGGILTKHLANHPYGIVVIDEFEKATSSLQDLLLGLLDGRGKLKDFEGHDLSCKNTIFIFTSNLDAGYLSQPEVRNLEPDKVVKELKDHMRERGVRPEFIGRLQKTLPFFPPNKKELDEIVIKELQELNQREDYRSMTFIFEPSLTESLAKAFSPKEGVRGVQNEVEKISSMLSKGLDEEGIPPDAKVRLYVENGRLAYEVVR